MGRRRVRRRLAVWSNGDRVGIWESGGSVPASFKYDENWLAAEYATPLSITMPLAPAAYYRGDVVEAFFDNLLPDNKTTLARLQARFRTSSDSAPDLLAEIGRDCVGAIQITAEDAVPPSVNNIDGTPLSDQAIERLLDQVLTAQGDSNDDDFRISIAGAQEKTGLLWHNGQWHRPHGTTPSTHIFKLPIGLAPSGIDLSRSVENEWCCLALLRELGVPVANSTMARFGQHKVLIVERFDRALTADGLWWQRLHQEDFCQATGLSPALKYEADGGPGIATIMQLLLGSQQAEADRLRFLKLQILFWLLAAIDGHAKNFSVHLFAMGRYRLTPTYDVMSAFPVQGTKAGKLSPHKIKMAMSLHGKNRHDHHREIQLRHFYATFKPLGLTKEVIDTQLMEITRLAPTAIEKVAKAAIAEEFDRKPIDAILDGFAMAIKTLN